VHDPHEVGIVQRQLVLDVLKFMLFAFAQHRRRLPRLGHADIAGLTRVAVPSVTPRRPRSISRATSESLYPRR
jgi:hypothetical protein